MGDGYYCMASVTGLYCMCWLPQEIRMTAPAPRVTGGTWHCAPFSQSNGAVG